MRCLALARYRFLLLIRRTRWIFPLLLLIVLGPVAAGGMIRDERINPALAPDVLLRAAGEVLVVYFLHIVTISLFCWSFGIVPTRPEGMRPADLMDTVPLSGQTRFWGDALGIFGAAAVIHLCLTPVLAASIALSSLPSSLFWWLELAIMAVLLFLAASASWGLSTNDTRRSRVNTIGGQTLFLLLLALVLLCTTRVEEFRDALGDFLNTPAPARWSGVVAAVDNGPLFVTMVTALYASFIAYFAIQSARAFERG